MEEKPLISPGIMESLWRFLASLKLTVVLLLCVAVLSVIGTLIPQNLSPNAYVQQYGLFGYRLMSLLDLSDMYHSWWYLGLLFLLVVNIIVCSIDRLQSTAKIIFVRKPKFDPQRYRNRSNRQDFSSGLPYGRLKAPYQRFLSRRFAFCEMTETPAGFAVAAEKGRWTRLGVYVVHLSIVVLLFGGLIGARFGFEGFVAIPEGETAQTIRLTRSAQNLRLPFAIRCDDFDLQFYEGTQRPKEFRSRLTVLEEGREVLRKEIVVNDPLIYKGIGIYQSSYGRLDDRPAPSVGSIDPSAPVELAFHSSASGMIYKRQAAIGQKLEIPEGLGVFILEQFQKEAQFKGMELGPTWIGKLTDAAGETHEVLLPLNYPRFDAMRAGAVTVAVESRAAQRPPERFYTGLQVVYDPGVWVVYAGFILLIAGCAVTFFMTHQQIVVEVTGRGEKSAVMVSGVSNKNKVGFEMKLKRLTGQLEELARNPRGGEEPGS